MNLQHIMDQESKIPTLFGLIIEGLTLVFTLSLTLLYAVMFRFGLRLPLQNFSFPHVAWNGLFGLFSRVYGLIILALIMSYLCVILINLFLFTGLMSGRYTNEKAQKIYTYQMIYGGVSMVFNPLLGLLYLFSGYKGKEYTRS